MRIFLIIFYLLLILMGVSFAVLNATPVSLNLYVTTYSMPVSVLITLAIGLGVLIGSFLVITKYWRVKIELHKIKSQLKLKEKEINNLRSIPLKDQH
jgi:lipopolysaccharide assembly protein A